MGEETRTRAGGKFVKIEAVKQGIQSLGNKHYGHLSEPVRSMGAQLSWGVSLTKAMTSFISKVDSWVTKAIGVLSARYYQGAHFGIRHTLLLRSKVLSRSATLLSAFRGRVL